MKLFSFSVSDACDTSQFLVLARSMEAAREILGSNPKINGRLVRIAVISLDKAGEVDINGHAVPSEEVGRGLQPWITPQWSGRSM